MSTTAEKQVQDWFVGGSPEPEVAAPTKTVAFISKCPNQVLTRRKARHVEDGLGGKKVEGQEEWLQRQEDINDARLLRGDDPLPIDRTPWKVEFAHNVFKTDNPKLIEWMRSHRLFNNPAGFWEMGAAPDEPKPTLDQQMTAIAEAAASGDLPGVEAVISLENETHKRPSVLQVAEAAATRLREFGSELESGAPTDSGGGSPSKQPSS
jgi:hypothetical protein